MKLKNILIVTDDIDKARKFYEELFGLELVTDNEGNMILTQGLALQDRKIWEKFLGKETISRNNSTELYLRKRISKDL